MTVPRYRCVGLWWICGATKTLLSWSLDLTYLEKKKKIQSYLTSVDVPFFISLKPSLINTNTNWLLNLHGLLAQSICTVSPWWMAVLTLLCLKPLIFQGPHLYENISMIFVPVRLSVTLCSGLSSILVKFMSTWNLRIWLYLPIRSSQVVIS